MSDKLYVNAMRDAEAGVFYVDSNVPGLNVEADTLPELVEVLNDVLPDLVHANVSPLERGAEIQVHFSTDLAFA